jgi:photosystem II stability/assembly factor-like uncharacterized protein
MMIQKLVSRLSLIGVLIFLPCVLQADPLDHWYWRNLMLGRNTFDAVVYRNGTFVVVGEEGTILTSADGVKWTLRNSGTTHRLRGISYGKGTFVAVGCIGTVVTSADGVTWTPRNSGIDEWLDAITYGNGTFVAVGEKGTILTSSDGVTWISRFSGTTHWLGGTTYGDGRFIVAGDKGVILTSPDGATWTLRTSGTTYSMYGISYDGGNFVAVGYEGAILTSPDGLSWTPRTSGTDLFLYEVTYGNGTFVAVGWDGLILTSQDDGVTWTPRNSGVDWSLHGVTYGNGTFVAVGYDGTLIQSDPVSSDIFSDVPASHWAYNYINAIYNAGITTGYGDGRFGPEDNVSREQMAAFIVRAKEGEPPSNYCDSGNPFPDVAPDMWPCKYIKKLYELGITTGYADGTYRPYDLVPREQMATFIVRAVEGEPPEDYCDSGSAFSDVTATMWSCRYIKRLKELNITTGYGDGTYGPYDLVTRAQMAAFLSRAFLGME